MHNLNKYRGFSMIKKIAVALLCTALGSSLYARERQDTSGNHISQ